MNATSSRARVDRELRALLPRNGSNLDAGIAAAGEWLSRVEGTKRVIVFTDERLSDRLAGLDAASLASRLPPGTVVHVVGFDINDGGLDRDDNVSFGSLAWRPRASACERAPPPTATSTRRSSRDRSRSTRS